MNRFFDEGDKVKVTLKFRGREMAHQELGMKLLLQVKGAFPTAFIVKGTIGYPVVDRFHSYTVEAVRTDNQE